MAKKNEFLPFSNNATSNVIDQSAYESLDARKTGFSSGVAKSAQLNKVWRQSSIMAAALGQFISDKNGVDILDDGDVPKLVAEMNKAISGGAAGVKTFNGASGDITISQGNNITITKNGNDFKIDASGGTAGVTTLNNLSGAVKLVAGANVTITPNGNNLTIAASGGGGGAVTSVNGKTGAVTLTHTDVGAPSTTGVGASGSWNINAATATNSTQLGGVAAANYYNKATDLANCQGALFWGGTSANAPIGIAASGIRCGAATSYTNGNTQWIAHYVGSNQFKFNSDGTALKKGGGAWGDSSDSRLKTNVKTLTVCLDVVNQLNPVEYNWKDGYRGGESQVGFIADEVEKVIPSAVSDYLPIRGRDGEFDKMDQEIVDRIGEGVPIKMLGFQNDIFAYLVGAIKELDEKLTSKQKQYDELLTRLVALEAKVK